MFTHINLDTALEQLSKGSSVDLSLAMEQLNLNSNVAPTPTLESFHLFSQLAPELRLKIWSYACFPRVLPIQYHSTSTSPRTARSVVTKFTSSAAPPALLSVCHEARTQALTIYILSFATATSPGRIYVDPNRDTLYFPRTGQMGYDETVRDFSLNLAEQPVMDPNQLQRKGQSQGGKAMLQEITSIALDYVDVNIKRPWEGYNKACLIRSFPNLEEIFLVVRPSEQNTPAQKKVEDSMGMEFGFCVPKIEPERLLRWWAGFRMGFGLEEKELEERCKSEGREYVSYQLPVVRSVGRCVREDTRREVIE